MWGFFFYSCSIDAAIEHGSLGRLVNDDPKPNSKVKKIEVDGIPHLCLFAIKDIHEGQEIMYDYGGVDLPWRSCNKHEKTKVGYNGFYFKNWHIFTFICLFSTYLHCFNLLFHYVSEQLLF